jgi:hypothetical protein
LSCHTTRSAKHPANQFIKMCRTYKRDRKAEAAEFYLPKLHTRLSSDSRTIGKLFQDFPVGTIRERGWKLSIALVNHFGSRSAVVLLAPGILKTGTARAQVLLDTFKIRHGPATRTSPLPPAGPVAAPPLGALTKGARAGAPVL